MADPSKTEKATPRRQEEYRKKGSIAKSTEVNTALTLLSAFLVLKFTGPFIYKSLIDYTRYYFSNMHTIQIDSMNIGNVVIGVIVQVLLLVVPLMVAVLVGVILASIIQVGFIITLEPIKPNLGKLNFIKGFQNLVSIRSLENLVKSLIKVLIIGYVAYITVRDNFPLLFNFFDLNVQQSFLIVARLALELIYKILLVFIVIAIIDYAFQRWQTDKQMRMSKQEIKEEYKRTEGDPLIKGEIRRRQSEMARHRMMAEVPKADVVVTNPIHLAVALQYNAQEMRAPMILAKGMRLVAEHIKEIARENNIPVLENPPIAQALFKTGKVGSEIPSEMYSAVAEILTYIYRLSGKTFGI